MDGPGASILGILASARPIAINDLIIVAADTPASSWDNYHEDGNLGIESDGN